MVMSQLLRVVFRVVSRLAHDMAADKERELSSLAREDAGGVDIVNDMDSKSWLNIWWSKMIMYFERVSLNVDCSNCN